MYIRFNSPCGKGCKQALHYLFFGIIHCKQLVAKLIFFSIQKSLSAQAQVGNASPMMVRMPVILQRAPELQVTRGHVHRCLYLGIVPNCGQFFQVIQSALQLLVASHHVGTGYRVYRAVDKR